MQRSHIVTTLALATLIAGGVHSAVAARGSAPANLIGIDTPVGIRGRATGETSIPLTFRLERIRAASVRVEFEYGWDRNADGTIDDAEFRPLSIERGNRLNTGKSRSRTRFRTSGAPGRMHTIVWQAIADLPNDNLRANELLRTPQGRAIPDPASPEDFLKDPASQGVIVRARTRKGRGRNRRIGDWVTTDAISIDNQDASIPTARITDVVRDLGEAGESDDVVLISYDLRDSRDEDRNGNGTLELDEDLDRDGVLDTPIGGVAVDYHRLDDGVDPSRLDLRQLEELDWLPATRFEGAGDADSELRATFDGTSYDFAWYAVSDQLQRDGRYIVRIRPWVDGRLGPWQYDTTPVEPFGTDE